MFSADIHDARRVELMVTSYPDDGQCAAFVTLRLIASCGDERINNAFTVFSRALSIDRLEIAVAAFNAAMRERPDVRAIPVTEDVA